MSATDNYRYKILKEHGLLVDFDSLVVRNSVPGYVENETFGQWKRRTFGDAVVNVAVYYPLEICDKHQISLLCKHPDAIALKQFFRYLDKRFPTQPCDVSAKEKYCRGIVKKYGLIVSFDGHVKRNTVPRYVKSETARQWRRRVFGDKVSEVSTYFRSSIPNKTLMASIRADTRIDRLQNIFGYLAKESRAVKTEVAQKTARETTSRLERFASETIEGLVKELPALRPNVSELVDDLVRRTKDGTCSEQFLKTVLSVHVGALRELKFN